MPSKRFEHIDFLRGISILGVIFVHTLFYDLSNPFNRVLWNTLEFVVAGFIFCSGYSWEARYSGRLKAVKDTLFWYRKRFLRILIPFWVYLVIHFGLVYFFPGLFSGLGLGRGLGTFLKSALFIKAAGLNWLPLLFLELTVLFSFLTKLSKKFLGVYFSGAFLLTGYFTVFEFNRDFYRNFEFLPWSLVLVLAVMFYRLDKKAIKNLNYLKGVLISFLVFMAAFLCIKLKGESLDFILHKYPPDLYYLSFATLLTFIVVILFNQVSLKQGFLSKAYVFLSVNSYRLFFIHYVILDFLLNFYFRLHLPFNILSAFLNLVLSVLICFLYDTVFVWLRLKKRGFLTLLR